MLLPSNSSTRLGRCSARRKRAICLAKPKSQDLGRYDFIKDIERIENIVTDRAPHATGYAILLTNYPSYWTRFLNDNTVDVKFRLHEGSNLHGS